MKLGGFPVTELGLLYDKLLVVQSFCGEAVFTHFKMSGYTISSHDNLS